MGAFPTGVCLVTTVGPQGKREGMTINSFASLSLSPPLILWSVCTAARSAVSFLSASHFIVNVLSIDQKALAPHFARPARDKFDAFESMFDTGLGGCPRLKASVSTFECRRHTAHEEGDHSVLIGRIERFDSTALLPLVFMRTEWAPFTSMQRRRRLRETRRHQTE
ncbi:flavin reductase family protein [Burkholderia sp. MR1-5-21]